MSRVLVIPDLHAPAIHPRAFDFVRSIQDAWQTDRTIFLGDAFDLAACSYHTKRTELMNAISEWEEAIVQIQPFYDHFKTADFLIGNHDALVARKALDSGIPNQWLKPERELFGMPKGWNIVERFGTVKCDGVSYRHGDCGPGGQFPAIAHAKELFSSVVLGHFHSAFGVQFYANDNMRVFGCQAGSLCDHHHLAQEYGKRYNRKPLLGCAIVIDGVHCVPEVMPVQNRGCK